MTCIDSPDQIRLWLFLGVVRADPELGCFRVDSCEMRLRAGKQQMRGSAGSCTLGTESNIPARNLLACLEYSRA